MLKKSIAVLALVISSSSVFAKNSDSTLTVTPNHPDDWGYQNATVKFDSGPVNNIGKGVTIPAPSNNSIELTVYAMNAKPRLSPSCSNLKIQQGKSHYTLLFELKPDWLIHCKFYQESK